MSKNNNRKKATIIEDLLSCFNDPSNNNTNYYIQIFINLPTIHKSDKFFERRNDVMRVNILKSFSMGHTFLKLCQINNSRILEKYLGFYPDRKMKAFFIRTFIKGKLVDDADHKYNASLRMYLT